MTKRTKFDFLSSDEFSMTMGRVAWLLTLSTKYRDKPISFLEAHVSAPLMMKQVRLFTRGKQPIAAICWAYASDEVAKKVQSGDYEMGLMDWRSGKNIIVVECISPLMDKQFFIDQFMSQVNSSESKSKN